MEAKRKDLKTHLDNWRMHLLQITQTFTKNYEAALVVLVDHESVIDRLSNRIAELEALNNSLISQVSKPATSISRLEEENLEDTVL